MPRGPVPAQRRKLIWLAVLGPIVLALGAGLYAAAALPGCASCHDAPAFVEATAAGAHAATACHDCHVGVAPGDRLAFGFREVFHMVVPLVSGAGKGWETVPDGRCVFCHDIEAGGATTSGGIRIAHASCAVGSACTGCHSATAHGETVAWVRVYDMETCLACHVSEASTQCDLCHEGRLPANRVTSGVFAITHGADWQRTHGMGNSATCTVCHTAANCEKCHGVGLPHGLGFVSEHADYAASAGAQCAGCHETSFCSGCHGLDMPHPQAFIRGHAAEAVANEALCARCHAAPDCTECHETHVHPGGAVGGLGGGG